MMWTFLALTSLFASAIPLTVAQSEGLGWHFIQNGSTQLTALEAIVVSPTLLVVFDRVRGDPLQINGHQAWGAIWNTETNNVTAIDVLTDSFCASGGFLSNGTMVSSNFLFLYTRSHQLILVFDRLALAVNLSKFQMAKPILQTKMA
jgi:hypothetical protein